MGVNMGRLSQIKMNSIDYHIYTNSNDPEKYRKQDWKHMGEEGGEG